MEQNRVNITVTATDQATKPMKAVADQIRQTGKASTAAGEAMSQAARRSTQAAQVSVSAWSTLKAGVLGVAGALGVVQIAAEVFSRTIGAGFKRLSDLEIMRRRMEQMGVSVENVNYLMSELNDTLVGTPYALNAGSTAMARLVASGMKVKDIPKYFRDIVDAAAFGQADLNEVADIFVKIQAEGQIYAERMNQLTSRSLPAYQILATGMGITGDALRDMMRKGEISSAEFFAAWHKGAQGFGEDNVVIAGSAQSMGEVTKGAIANAATAFARLGANLLEKVWPAFKKVADGARATADGLGKVVDFFQENRAAAAVLSGVLAALAANFVKTAAMAVASAVQSAVAWVRATAALFAADVAAFGLMNTMRALMTSTGFVGIALMAAGAALSLFMTRGEGSKKVNEDLLASLDDLTGALTETTRKIAYKSLVESGAIESAKTMGISIETLTDAALGNADAIAAVNEATHRYIVSQTEANAASGEAYKKNVAANKVAEVVTKAIGEQTEEVTAARQAWEDEQAAMGNAGAQASETGDTVADLTEQVEGQTEATNAARDAIEAYDDAMRSAVDPVFALMNAVTGVNDAQAKYNSAVAENGAASQEAADAAVALANANIDLASAANDADLNFGAFTDQLNRMVEAGQLTAEQADLVRQQIDGARQAAENFGNPYVASIRVDVDQASLVGARAAIQAAMRVSGRVPTYTGTSIPMYQGSQTIPRKASGGVVGHAAEGGPRNGLTLVGEDGPELANLPPGTQVTPAGQTANMLGQGGGVTEVRLVVEAGGAGKFERMMVELIREFVRVKGGNVQTAFGV